MVICAIERDGTTFVDMVKIEDIPKEAIAVFVRPEDLEYVTSLYENMQEKITANSWRFMKLMLEAHPETRPADTGRR